MVTTALHASGMSRQRHGALGLVLLIRAAIPLCTTDVTIGSPLRDAISNLRPINELVSRGTGLLNAEYETAQGAIRSAAPLPKVSGPISGSRKPYWVNW